mgnify:CR=1 FL=1
MNKKTYAFFLKKNRKKNPIAKDLSDGRYHQRVVKGVGNPVEKSPAQRMVRYPVDLGDASIVVENDHVNRSLDDMERFGLTQVLVGLDVDALLNRDEHFVELVFGVRMSANPHPAAPVDLRPLDEQV